MTGPMGQGISPTEFGVARLYINGTANAASWTGDVPDDGNNPAQTSGTTVVPCAGGDVFSVQAAFRTDEADGGQAGGGLVVTAANGTLLGADQTPANGQYGGVRVVNVGPSSKTSNEPIGNDDPVIASVTIPSGVSGQCIVNGTAEFFDFDDSPSGEG